jgi:hypothetical protein
VCNYYQGWCGAKKSEGRDSGGESRDRELKTEQNKTKQREKILILLYKGTTEDNIKSTSHYQVRNYQGICIVINQLQNQQQHD